MIGRITVFAIVHCLVGAGLIALAAVAWRNREHPVGPPLAVMAVGTAGWALSNGLRPFVSNPAVVTALGLAEHPLAGLTALGWMYVAVAYTDTQRLTGRWLATLLFGVVLVDTILVATNPLHQSYAGPESRITADGLYVFETGPLYAYHAVYGFGFAFLGWGLFGRAYLKSRGVYRKQVLVILGSATVAIGLIAVEVATRPIPGLSLGVLGMAFAAGGFCWSIFVADFLNTVPVARETLVESMDDAVIGLDTADHIVALNPAGRKLFGLTDTAVGQPVTDVLDSHPTFVEWFESADDTNTELTVDIDGGTHHYAVSVSPVISETGVSDAEIELGRAVVIRDISDRIERQRRLEAQTDQLAAQKERLQRQHRRLDRFGSAISRDLEASLAEARSHLETTRTNGEPDQIQAVREAHTRMQNLIDDILTTARVDTDTEATEPVDLPAVIQEAWAETGPADGRLTLTLPDDVTLRGTQSVVRAIFETLFRTTVTDGTTVTVELVDGDGSPVGIDVIVAGREPTESSYDTDVSHMLIEELVDTCGWSIERTGGDRCRFEIRNVELSEVHDDTDAWDSAKN